MIQQHATVKSPNGARGARTFCTNLARLDDPVLEAPSTNSIAMRRIDQIFVTIEEMSTHQHHISLEQPVVPMEPIIYPEQPIFVSVQERQIFMKAALADVGWSHDHFHINHVNGLIGQHSARTLEHGVFAPLNVEFQDVDAWDVLFQAKIIHSLSGHFDLIFRLQIVAPEARRLGIAAQERVRGSIAIDIKLGVAGRIGQRHLVRMGAAITVK